MSDAMKPRSGPRQVRLVESSSGLDARCLLLDGPAPANGDILWQLAQTDASFGAIHAMWTGPEISVPIDGAAALPSAKLATIPLENATSFPQAGDIALVCAPQGTWRDGPPFDLIDIGIFYASGGRLLMPMGWIMASVCARILEEDLPAAAAACRAIRDIGRCEIRLVPTS